MTEFDQIAAQRPETLEQTLVAMRRALDYFHANRDYRAVFLRAYYITTLNIADAVHQRGEYTNQIFFDAAWVDRLAAKFAVLYFQSLTTFERKPDPHSERAWKTAHGLAMSRRSTVIQDLILGLNAHINYDLAYGIFLNFKEHGDGADHLILSRRKFDHDQINNILIRTIPAIQETLTRDYGGGIMLVSRAMYFLDEILTGVGLKHYRERVWWSAISYLAAADDRCIDLVHDRLNWESYQIAKRWADESAWTLVPRMVGKRMRKKVFASLELEGDLTVFESSMPRSTRPARS